MRRPILAALLVLALAATMAAPAAAHPRRALDPTLPTDVTFAATDNVEYLGRFPEHTGTASGRRVGDLFYLTDPRGVWVYDISDPASPDLAGSLLLPQRGTGVALAQEDVDTDGKILLVDAVDPNNTEASPDNPALNTNTEAGTLQVVDVSDPANMSVIGTLDVADHTWTCVSATDDTTGEVNGCAYAYGRDGYIIDLTDPTNPTQIERTWRDAVGYGSGLTNTPYTHDLTEIRPGLVMSAGAESILMDTSDPANPVELTRIKFFPPRWSQFGYHSVEWANAGTDPILVAGTELAPNDDLAGSDCQKESDGGSTSVVETFDATAVADALVQYEAGDLTAEDFRTTVGFGDPVDAFDAGSRGLFINGEAPSHVLYCAHWMELHPDFAAGGKMVVSYYDRGTRFVDVAADGTMTEIGWIVPAEGYSGSAQWITDEIVYIMDYRRGLEVVRLLPGEAEGVYENGLDIIAAGSSVSPLHAHGPDRAPLTAVAAGLVLLVGALWRRERAYATSGRRR